MSEQAFSRVEEQWQATGTGTTAGVTVTKAAPSQATDVYCVTSIDCSGDAAAVVTIESPSGTVLWRKRFAAAFNMSEEWDIDELKGAPGQAILVKISASTANCEANMTGYRLGG